MSYKIINLNFKNSKYTYIYLIFDWKLQIGYIEKSNIVMYTNILSRHMYKKIYSYVLIRSDNYFAN